MEKSRFFKILTAAFAVLCSVSLLSAAEAVWNGDAVLLTVADGDVVEIRAGANGTLIIPDNAEITIKSDGEIDNGANTLYLVFGDNSKVVWQARVSGEVGNFEQIVFADALSAGNVGELELAQGSLIKNTFHNPFHNPPTDLTDFTATGSGLVSQNIDVTVKSGATVEAVDGVAVSIMSANITVGEATINASGGSSTGLSVSSGDVSIHGAKIEAGRLGVSIGWGDLVMSDGIIRSRSTNAKALFFRNGNLDISGGLIEAEGNNSFAIVMRNGGADGFTAEIGGSETIISARAINSAAIEVGDNVDLVVSGGIVKATGGGASVAVSLKGTSAPAKLTLTGNGVIFGFGKIYWGLPLPPYMVTDVIKISEDDAGGSFFDVLNIDNNNGIVIAWDKDNFLSDGSPDYKSGESTDLTWHQLWPLSSAQIHWALGGKIYYELGDNSGYIEIDGVTVVSGESSIFNRPKNLGAALFKENPAREKMEIMLPDGERLVKFTVFDVAGNVVFTTPSAVKNNTGDRDGRPYNAANRGATVAWDLRNSAGRFVANGSYLVVVEAIGKDGKVRRYSGKVGVKR